MNIFMLGFISGLLFWPVIGSAELYKWTDDQGNFHITDMPPPGAQKKSVTTAAPAARSTLPKKARARPILPGQPQAEVRSIPDSTIPPASEAVPVQRVMEGLNPSQAALTSSWHIFDSAQMNAKAPVQWWKDKQGLDHFADVLPVAKEGTEVGAKVEDVSASHPSRRAGERATGVSHPRHQAIE